MTTQLPELDAILFDAGGVMVLPDPNILGPAVAPYGGRTDFDAHHRAHYAAMKAKSDAGHLEGNWSAYERAYAEAVDVDDEFLDHAAELLALVRTAHVWRFPVAGARDHLVELEMSGMPIGVVSNASGQIEAELGRQQICQVGPGAGAPMRVIVDSHVVGVAKPDPRIFDFALGAFDGIDRSRIGFVGDSVTMDVGGATAAGLVPILIDPYDDHPDIDVVRIGGLADLLDRLSATG